MNLIDALIDALIARPCDATCDALCDALIDAPLTDDDANRIMIAARSIDPTESLHAAHIRDTIRDNHEIDLD